MSRDPSLLRVTDLSGGYGGPPVLRHVSLRADDAEVVVLLGRNGTGKTTLLRAVMGLLPAVSGSIRVGAHELAGMPTHRRARLGIGYVPQGRGIFADASVEQNLRYGALPAGRPMRSPLPDGLLDMFPRLRERLGQRAGTLSGGEQQMLALARALVGDPKLLLLDEPTEGLAPAIVQHLADALRGIQAEGRHTILLIEQNLRFAQSLASRGYYLEKGQIVAEGDTQALLQEDLVARHLGI